MNSSSPLTLDELAAAEARSMALAYVSEAFAEAILDGIDVDDFAEAAVCAAFRELVAVYGEARVADIAAKLPDRVRAGEFSNATRQ